MRTWPPEKPTVTMPRSSGCVRKRLLTVLVFMLGDWVAVEVNIDA